MADAMPGRRQPARAVGKPGSPAAERATKIGSEREPTPRMRLSAFGCHELLERPVVAERLEVHVPMQARSKEPTPGVGLPE